MRENKTKAKLLAGETVLGCFLRYPDPSLAEFVALMGWDFLMFDGEHGVMEPADCENLVRAAELRDVTPIARVPTNQPHVILRMLDTGVGGIHVPWVNSGAEAEAAVQAIKYGPRGMRGLAGVRAADFGQTMTLGEYVRWANMQTLTIIHIETGEAADRIEEYLTIEDLDVIFIGPTDLSHSLGVPGHTDHPRVVEAIDRVVDAARGAGKVFGTLVSNTEEALAWKARGAGYIAISFEPLFRSASRAFLERVRAD